MKKQYGLSLIEILVSIAIIGIVIVAVAGSMVSNLKISANSNEQSLAMEYVNGALEQYRIYWKNPIHYRSAATPDSLSELNDMLPSSFNVTLSASNLNIDGTPSTATPPPLRRITITVSNDGRTLALGTTLIGNPN